MWAPAGGTLEDRLRDGPLAPAQAVSVGARLADALAALHEKKCLHGAVKPSIRPSLRVIAEVSVHSLPRRADVHRRTPFGGCTIPAISRRRARHRPHDPCTSSGESAAAAARKRWNRTPRLRGSCAPAFLVLTKSGRSACALDLLNVSGGYAARAGRESGEARSWPAASPQG